MKIKGEVVRGTKVERGKEYFTRKQEKLTALNKKLFIVIIAVAVCVAAVVGTAAYMFYSKSTQNEYIAKAYSEDFRTKQAVFKIEPVTTNVLGQTKDIVYTDIGNFQIDGVIKSNRVVVYTDIYGKLQLIDTMTLQNATDYFCYVYSDYVVGDNEIELDDTSITLEYSGFLTDMAAMEKTSALLDIFKIIGIAVSVLFFVFVITLLIIKQCIKVYKRKGSEFEAVNIAVSNKIDRQKAYEQGIEALEESNEVGESIEEEPEEKIEHLAPQSKKELKQRKKEDINRAKDEAKQAKEDAKRAKQEAKMKKFEQKFSKEDTEVKENKRQVEVEVTRPLVEKATETKTVSKPASRPTPKPAAKPVAKPARPNVVTSKPPVTKKVEADDISDINIEDDEMLNF